MVRHALSTRTFWCYLPAGAAATWHCFDWRSLRDLPPISLLSNSARVRCEDLPPQSMKNCWKDDCRSDVRFCSPYTNFFCVAHSTNRRTYLVPPRVHRFPYAMSQCTVLRKELGSGNLVVLRRRRSLVATKPSWEVRLKESGIFMVDGEILWRIRK